MRPWTVQERISGFLQMGSKLYMTVNGYGFLVAEANHPDFLEANQIYDRGHLAGMTLGRVFCRGGTGFVQVYHDTVLSQEGSPSKVSLIMVSPDQPGLRTFSFPLQTAEPGWEAVDLLESGSGWYCAWKKTEPDKVRFLYAEHSMDGGIVREIDRERFFAEYQFADCALADPVLAGRLAPHLHSSGSGAVFHIILSAPFAPEAKRYSMGDRALLERGEAQLLTVRIFRTGESQTALLGNGTLLRMTETPGEASRVIPLPELPKGFEYTDLWTSEDTVVLSWEERNFTEIGVSGLLSFPLR